MPDALINFWPDTIWSWEAAFLAANTAAFWGWVILLFAPRGIAWLHAIPKYLLPLAVSAAYAAILASQIGSLNAGAGYMSLDGLRALASADAVLVAGWMHVVAFDLFIGAWAAERMDAACFSRLIQVPILLAIFMTGPLGFLIAWAVTARSRV